MARTCDRNPTSLDWIGPALMVSRDTWLVTPRGVHASHSGPTIVFVDGTSMPIFLRNPSASIRFSLFSAAATFGGARPLARPVRLLYRRRPGLRPETLD